MCICYAAISHEFEIKLKVKGETSFPRNEENSYGLRELNDQCLITISYCFGDFKLLSFTLKYSTMLFRRTFWCLNN